MFNELAGERGQDSGVHKDRKGGRMARSTVGAGLGRDSACLLIHQATPPRQALSLHSVCPYLRALADVEVGLLFGFTQHSQMKDHHLVLLLL